MTTEGLADAHELHSWFVARIEKFLAGRGRRLVGWDEILDGNLADRGSSAVVQAWRGMDRAAAAARTGFDVIVSPTSHAYFDYDPGVLDLRQVHGFDPVPEVLVDDEAASRIMGGALNLWTEYIPAERVDTMVFPRLLGMAEALWTSPVSRDYPEFLDRVDRHRPLLEHLEVRPGPAARPLTIRADVPGSAEGYVLGHELDESLAGDFAGHQLVVRWRTTPVSAAPDFRQDRRPEEQGLPPVTAADPVLIPGTAFNPSGPTLVQGQLFIGDRPYGAFALLPLEPHLAVRAPVSFTRPPSSRFGADLRRGLTDGLRGSRIFDDGCWCGFEGHDLEATVDLGELKPLAEVAAGFIQDANAWIFLPRRIDVSLSDDGRSWRPAGEAAHAVSDRDQEKVIRQFRVVLEGARARFIRLVATSPGVCPPWHPGRGEPCWIFADEIVVR